MKNIIKKWLGITSLKQDIEYIAAESSVAFNRATYALSVVLEEITSDAVKLGNTKKGKKEVKKITKNNKSKK